GNGVDTLFWDEAWLGDVTLRHIYLRVYALETNKLISVAEKLEHQSVIFSLRREPRGGAERGQEIELSSRIADVVLSQMQDRWRWSLTGSGDFSVASVRKYIDDRSLPDLHNPTRWVNAMPIKVNVLAWKVSLENLPTRLNLSIRGMKINSILCSICDAQVESTDHLMFSCSLASDMVRKVMNWWGIGYPELGSYVEWLSWFKQLRINSKAKKVFEGIFYAMGWQIWGFRNKTLFVKNTPKKATLFDDLVTLTFQWCNASCKANMSWVGWLQNPMLIIM
ncbi:RNA-directed DNA polymerase, eukaryota, partial [Tanacetum coccineum]